MTSAQGIAPRPLSEFLGVALFTVLLTNLFVYLAYWSPVRYGILIAEDSWVEYGTAVAWGLAGGVFLFRFVRGPRRAGHLAFGLGAILIALEEMSWGQRILGLETPALLAEHNLQKEITLHNLAEPESYYPFLGWLVLIFAVGLPVTCRLVPAVARLCARLGVPVVPVSLWPIFLLPVFLLDYMWRILWLPATPELMELTLGLAVLMLAVRVQDPTRRGGTALLADVGAGTITLALTLPLVLGFPSPRRVEKELHALALVEYPTRGLWRQAEEVWVYLAAHPGMLQPDALARWSLIQAEREPPP